MRLYKHRCEVAKKQGKQCRGGIRGWRWSGIVNFAENINESLIILCIKWKNDKIKNVVNIRHIIFEEQSDLGNSMSF